MQELDSRNKTSEICPGVILHQTFDSSFPSGNNELIGKFIWKIEIQTMSEVDIETSLNESENVEIEGSNSLITFAHLKPFEKKEIVKIILKKDWKLKSKFGLTLNVPDKSIQNNFIKNDIVQANIYREKCAKIFKNVQLELYDLETIEKMLQDNKIEKFVDDDFRPEDESIYNGTDDTIDNIFDYLIHWRRPENFVYLKGKHEPKLFNGQGPEPNDIHQGILPDHHIASAISAIAEKPQLVYRLFSKLEVNKYGIYQVKLCLNGIWQTITVDDLFPCIPMTNPLVTSSNSNEIWVLLLEKALAKVFFCYYSIIDPLISDFLLILTGCPTFYFLVDEMVK